MDDCDRDLLILLQKGVPFVERPFEALGRRVGCDGADVLLRIQRLKDGGWIYRIAPHWNIPALRHRMIWAAFEIEETRLEEAGRLCAAHPAVFQVSARSHGLNLWAGFLLPEGEEAAVHAELLARAAGARSVSLFPVIAAVKGEFSGNFRTPSTITAEDVHLIRALQEDLPFADDPFRRMAFSEGMKEDVFLDHLRQLQTRGILKRLAAIPKGSRAGVSALVAWNIPGEQLDRAAAEIAKHPAVRWAYGTGAREVFPFTVHAALEASSHDALNREIEELRSWLAPWPFMVLAKVRDFKRSRLKFFPKDVEHWRRQTVTDDFSEAIRGGYHGFAEG